MRTQQHLGMMQLAQLVVVDGDESHLAQSLTLHTVMDDISQAIELVALGQFLLGFLDGGGHSEAEATAFVYFNL